MYVCVFETYVALCVFETYAERFCTYAWHLCIKLCARACGFYIQRFVHVRFELICNALCTCVSNLYTTLCARVLGYLRFCTRAHRRYKCRRVQKEGDMYHYWR